MNIIFLDVDGVLNEACSSSRAPNGFIGIDNEKVRRLRQIVDITGAKIVLTSSWKSDWSRDPELCGPDGKYLAKKLAKEDLHILDKTEDHVSNRGEGIQKWLGGRSDSPNWIVLDDDIFPDYEDQGIMPHLVKTGWYTGGLQDEHVKKAIDLLRGE